eukprot:6306881-Prymnesium_polylepis.1
MTRRDLEFAGQTLFNLTPSQAREWWSTRSSGCAASPRFVGNVSHVVSRQECLLEHDSAGSLTAERVKAVALLLAVGCCVSAVLALLRRCFVGWCGVGGPGMVAYDRRDLSAEP